MHECSLSAPIICSTRFLLYLFIIKTKNLFLWFKLMRKWNYTGLMIPFFLNEIILEIVKDA